MAQHPLSDDGQHGKAPRIGVRLPRDQHARVIELAQSTGETVSEPSGTRLTSCRPSRSVTSSTPLIPTPRGSRGRVRDGRHARCCAIQPCRPGGLEDAPGCARGEQLMSANPRVITADRRGTG